MRAAIYARVSTDRQGREQTVDSQLEAFRRWANERRHELMSDHIYIDEGYTGSRLDRPGLDALRDAVQLGVIDVVAVLSPDRLARKYAYQVLLLEELRKAGCQVVFLHRPITDDPQDQLLLQIQGPWPSTSGPSSASGSAAASSRRPARATGAVPPRQAPEGPRGPLARRQVALWISICSQT
jgi:hypothetical protein